PPEFFEQDLQIHGSYTYWPMNWMLAIENHSDSHNAFYVHRNSIQQLTSNRAGRNRTPLAPHGKIVNGRGLIAMHSNQDYYAKDGKVPYQMYYPGVKGVWPLHRRRLQYALRRSRRGQQMPHLLLLHLQRAKLARTPVRQDPLPPRARADGLPLQRAGQRCCHALPLLVAGIPAANRRPGGAAAQAGGGAVS